jgi:hypothetical protein
MQKLDFVCNACGHPSEPTREHLVHKDIARVLLDAPSLPSGQVRPSFEEGHFDEYLINTGPDEGVRRFNFNTAIGTLLCHACNDRAGKLERKAATALQAFLYGGAPADGQLLRQWAWYFALKLWLAEPTATNLGEGPLQPMLSVLLRDVVSVTMRVQIAELKPSGDPIYRFMGFIQLDKVTGFEYVMWVMDGLLWFVLPVPLVAPVPEPVARIPTVELVDGVQRDNLPRVRLRDLAVLPAVRSVIGDPRMPG